MNETISTGTSHTLFINYFIFKVTVAWQNMEFFLLKRFSRKELKNVSRNDFILYPKVNNKGKKKLIL